MNTYPNDTNKNEINHFNNQLYSEEDIQLFTKYAAKNNFSVADSMLNGLKKLNKLSLEKIKDRRLKLLRNEECLSDKSVMIKYKYNYLFNFK